MIFKNVKAKQYFIIDYYDSDEAIKEEYNVKEFCFAADQESGNDTSHSFTVRKETLDEYDQETINNLRAGKHQTFIARTLLVDMCNRNLIPEGEYLINVSW